MTRGKSAILADFVNARQRNLDELCYTIGKSSAPTVHAMNAVLAIVRLVLVYETPMVVKMAPRRRLRALRVRLRRIFPPLRFGAFPLRISFASHDRLKYSLNARFNLELCPRPPKLLKRISCG